MQMERHCLQLQYASSLIPSFLLPLFPSFLILFDFFFLTFFGVVQVFCASEVPKDVGTLELVSYESEDCSGSPVAAGMYHDY